MALADAELVAAMRRNDLRALHEFSLRFRPLILDQARRAGIPAGEREECVAEFLVDLALRLVEMERVPRTLAAYLAAAFRNRAASAHRDRARRDARDAGEASEVGGGGERAVASACSEHSLRVVHGPGADDGAPLPPAVAALAGRLHARLTESERELLTWAAHYVPTRVIAGWLGVGHSAAKLRLWRLRARLRDDTVRYAAALAPAEREELLRFFRRAAALDEDALATIERGTPPVAAPTPPSIPGPSPTRRRVAEEPRR
jgi:hypothetical protein